MTAETQGREESRTTAGLLHNMSCAPSVTIRHKSPYRRVNARGIIFALAPGRDMSGLTSDLIDAHARTLPYPAAALVTDRAEPQDERCADLLTIATVLAKSSTHVYLRDKTPNLEKVTPGRRVVLIVPKERRTA
jgi:hypothetical protein